MQRGQPILLLGHPPSFVSLVVFCLNLFGGMRGEEDWLILEDGARRLGKYKPMSPEEIEAEHNK